MRSVQIFIDPITMFIAMGNIWRLSYKDYRKTKWTETIGTRASFIKLEMALKNILLKFFPALFPSQVKFSSFFFLPGVITEQVFSGFCVHDSKIFWLFLTFFQSLFYIIPIEFAPFQPLNYITISYRLLLKSQGSISFIFS